MAEMVLKNAFFSLNGVDLSSRLTKITIKYGAEVIETTAMSSTGAKTKVAGLTDFSVSPEFNQDYAAGSVDATVFPLIGGANVPVVIRPNNAVASPTNPQYSGSVVPGDYSPVDGTVGQLLKTGFTWEGSGLLVRATS